MYGKIFDSIYDGTLRAHWQGLVTFQQLIILADKDGVIDMTPHAIHGRTGIPLEIIESGLDHLSKPDPYSRSSAEEGRRIVLLDEHRPWGWRLVNHDYYNKLRSAEEKRIADRDRISEKRKSIKSEVSHDVAECSGQSREVADVAPVAVAVAVAVTEESKTTPVATRQFKKPSLDEVKAYCKQRGNNVDPARFVSYYESNGWKVGRNKMVDWKAAIHTWEKSSEKTAGEQSQQNKQPRAFPQ
jgi:hypothetical protein